MPDGPQINRFDPSHPSLTAFEIDYVWEPVNENDLSRGLLTLFSGSIFFAAVLIFVSVSFTNDRSEKVKAKSNMSGSGRPTVTR